MKRPRKNWRVRGIDMCCDGCVGLLKKRSHGYFRNVKSVQQIKPIGSRQVLLQLLVNDA